MKRALITASVASMLDLFNRENIHILQDMGYQVEVAANFSFGSITSRKRVAEFRRELEQDRVGVYDIPIPRRVTDIVNIVKSYQMLQKLLDGGKYDLIHTQSPIGGVLTRLAVREVQRRSGWMCPYVIYTAHGFHFYRGAPLHRWIFFYPIEKWMSRYTDALITMNAEDYRRAKKFHAGHVFYIPGVGVELSAYYKDMKKRKRLREEFGFEDEDFVVLSVGQLSRRKNHETMIRAIELLNRSDVVQENMYDKHGKYCYVIVGIGEQEKKYQALIEKKGLKKYVCLAGYRSDIPDVLQMADCFAFPSLQEGLPVALMEAMAVGLPVVCSRIRGNCDLIRNGKEGMMLGPQDVKGFAKAIRWISRHPQIAEKYQKNAGRRIEAFSKEETGWKMRKIYELGK